MSHASLDELCAVAQGKGTADTKGHVHGCGECARAVERIRVGEKLLAEAREYSPSKAMQWSAIDDAINAAAEAAARGAKVEVLRARKRAMAQRWVTGGVFAAAAAGIFGWRMQAGRAADAGRIAVVAQQSATTNGAGSRDEAHAVEATVLLVAAPSTYEQGEAPAQALTLGTSLRAGVRLRTDERGGRMVVALGDGARVDARSGSDVTLDRWSSSEAVLALAKGETRVENSSGTEVSVRSAGWSLRSPGGAFVAKLEGDSLRVSVLQGKVTVRSADGSVSREVRAGAVLELAKDGTALREVSREASDASALPSGLLATRGVALELAALAGAGVGQLEIDGAQLALAGGFSLRLGRAVTAHATQGDARFEAVLDAAHGGSEARSVAWQSVSAPAVVAAVTPSVPVQRGARLGAPAVVAARPSAVAAVSSPSVPASEPVVVASDEEVAAAVSRNEAQLAESIRHCFNGCIAVGECEPHATLRMSVRVDAQGRVTEIQGIPRDDRGTQYGCTNSQVLITRWPAGTSRTLSLTVRR